MKKFKVLFLITLASFFLTGCPGDEKEGLIDYASMVTGTYSGLVSYNGGASVAATSSLNKSTEKTVNLVITIGTTTIPLNGIVVSLSTNNAYSLSYVDSSGTLTGTVNGNKLDWILNAGTDVVVFSGIK
jgi:hypothetical protein